VERLHTLLPETAELAIERFELANLRAVNFVVRGLLGQGVAATTRPDAQAKSLGEFLRSRTVELPRMLARQVAGEQRGALGGAQPARAAQATRFEGAW